MLYIGVASFTDAWIETGIGAKKRQEAASRIFYRCVDWNILVWIGNIIGISRIFYRCVDWNWKVATKEKETVGRIFYRCVDWNDIQGPIKGHSHKSHLLQMRGLKLFFL